MNTRWMAGKCLKKTTNDVKLQIPTWPHVTVKKSHHARGVKKKNPSLLCLSAKLAETPRTSDIAQVRESMKFMAATTLAHTEPLPWPHGPSWHPGRWKLPRLAFHLGDRGEKGGEEEAGGCGRAHSSLTKEARKTRQLSSNNNYSLLERTQI